MAQERQMPMRHRQTSEREQLDLFRALPGDLAPREAQDLMAYPFFSLAKSKRTVPIDFRAGKITIRVEAVPEHGMATIWDADVLIGAASQIVEARDGELKTSRLMAATPYEILTFVGRGTSARDYDRLKAAFDRLQSTTVMTSIRQPTERRRHRFSWINGWKETADLHGRALGLELILPDWFYTYHRTGARRTGALALSPRAQTWRSPGRWLELRSQPPSRQVRQPLAAKTRRVRPAGDRSSSNAARLSAADRAQPARRPVVRNDAIGALRSRSAGGKTTLSSHLAGLSARQLSYEGGTA
jgi:plasmid replication initiation protein